MRGSAQRKPLQLHVVEGKKHLSEQEKNEYGESEITMGEIKFTPSAEVKSNKDALKKWREITKIYTESGLVLVSSTDNGILARYCLEYADYLELVRERNTLKRYQLPKDDEDELFADTDAEYRRARARRLWGIMDYLTCLDGRLKLNDKINRKLKTILDIEDRIFLNPAAKVRTLPIRRKPKEESPLGNLGFDV